MYVVRLQDTDVPVFRSVVEQEFPEPEVEDKDHEGLILRLNQAARTLGFTVSLTVRLWVPVSELNVNACMLVLDPAVLQGLAV